MTEITEEKWRIWSEISKGIDEITGDLNICSDELHSIVFNKNEKINLSGLVDVLSKKELFLRIENDEEGFYLSVIDRKIYPRVWADNFKEGGQEITIESTEHLLQRSISGNEKDWLVRFNGEKLQECIEECFKWIKKQRS